MTSPRARTMAPLRPNRRFATARVVMALVLREMSARYGRSPGGYVWALLEPLGGTVVLAVGFSLVLRSPPLGTSFLLFYASGFLTFNIYLQLQAAISQSIRFSRPLLKYPAVKWTDAIAARFILNLLTGIMVFYILMTGIIVFTETSAVLDIPVLIEVIGFSALLGAGVGTLNCALIGLFPTWASIWSIITRPLFIASGIFFLYEDLPPAAQSVLWWNPLFHLTGLARAAVYPIYNPQYVSIPFVAVCGMVTLATGLMLLRKHHKTILNA